MVRKPSIAAPHIRCTSDDDIQGVANSVGETVHTLREIVLCQQLHHVGRAFMTCRVIVGQIMGPIVQIVIQAPHLARMFFGDYWSNLPEGPLENPRWRPFFSRWPPFSIKKN